MKILGAILTVLGLVFWVKPILLAQALVAVGLISVDSSPSRDLGDAAANLGSVLWAIRQVAVAGPWITLFGVLLFVGGQIVETQRESNARKRPRYKRRSTYRSAPGQKGVNSEGVFKNGGRGRLQTTEPAEQNMDIVFCVVCDKSIPEKDAANWKLKNGEPLCKECHTFWYDSGQPRV